jgi:endonuclease V-like protein UPF0215 family
MKSVSGVVTRHARDFADSEDGAVTVDWVVLTAVIIGMVLALFTILTDAVFETAASGIEENVTEAGVR